MLIQRVESETLLMNAMHRVNVAKQRQREGKKKTDRTDGQRAAQTGQRELTVMIVGQIFDVADEKTRRQLEINEKPNADRKGRVETKRLEEKIRSVENSVQPINRLQKKGVEKRATGAVEKITFHLTPGTGEGD